MEYILPAIVGAVLLFALASLLVSVFRVWARWHHNNRQPVLARPAQLISKDQNVWLVGGNKGVWSGDSTYCATFELADTKERLTFSVRPGLYAVLGEPRTAVLTYQGARLLGFGTPADGQETEIPD